MVFTYVTTTRISFTFLSCGVRLDIVKDPAKRLEHWKTVLRQYN